MSLTLNCEAATSTLTTLSVAERPSLLARFLAAVAREIRVRRDMRLLSSFDEAMLHDIGLGRSGLEDAIRHGRWEGAALDKPALRTDRTILPLSLTEWR